ncbi:Vacuolar protein sorting-associated protein 11 [Malassezia yamatoensis]|uniref:Vacuolar protein sorting-associated protein 11 n=1 Tax=Malassezia yamatoensis TaxID=253288 RepID=A0AAJ6CG25_9BASI|nr:Vacuolar protein sorting-associated protein 11 [Malassezia yamatoensis]
MSTSSKSSTAKQADTVLPSWRNFIFFDTQNPPERGAKNIPPSLPDKNYIDVVYATLNIADQPRNRGSLVLGLEDGHIHVVDAHSYKEFMIWRAHEHALHAFSIIQDLRTLLTVGIDSPNGALQLRLWRLASESANEKFEMAKQVLIRSDPLDSKVCAIDIHAHLSFVALGFDNGKVILLRDVRLDTNDSGAQKVHVVRETSPIDEHEQSSPLDGIRSLAFGEVADALYLMIATSSKVLRATIVGKRSGSVPTVIDTIGCAFGCAIKFRALEDANAQQTSSENGLEDEIFYSPRKLANKLVLARDEAVYVVGTEGREASIALEGPKVCLRPLHGQLALLSNPTQAGMSIEHPVMLGKPASAPTESKQLTIFDLDTKCVSYTAVIQSGVRDFWTSNSEITAFEANPTSIIGVLTRNSQLISFEEKDLKTKLEQLLRANLYILAVQFVRTYHSRFPHARLPDLKAGAIIIPPRLQERVRVEQVDVLITDIIRRYGDHLYTKGDFEGAILQFIKTIGVVSPSYIIRKFLDAQRLPFLIQYLESLHGKGLANADHTSLLLNCYTKIRDTESLDRFLRAPNTFSADLKTTAGRDVAPFDVRVAISVCRRGGCAAQAAYLAKTYEYHEEFLEITLRDDSNAKEAIEYLQNLPPALAELYVQQYARTLLDVSPAETTSLLINLYTTPIVQQGSSHIPSPQPLFPDFVGHEEQLIEFCEQIIKRRWERTVENQRGSPTHAKSKLSDSHETLLANTLLECYLSHDEYQEKALYVLYHPDYFPYSIEHALVLCSVSQCTPGILFLYERLGMYESIIEHWNHAGESSEEGAPSKLIDVLKQFGDIRPDLYVSVLKIFATSREMSNGQNANFQWVLDQIDERNLLSPLEVVQIVSEAGVVQLGAISEYLLRHVNQDQTELQGVRKLIHSYKTEIANKKEELFKLTTDSTPVVFPNQECDLCHEELSPPSIYFMCKHTFHRRCLRDGEDVRECLLCSQAHDELRSLQIAQSMANDYDVVLNDVQDAEDSFEVIASLFSRHAIR